MVQLLESDIRTQEVLDWKGLHVFHGQVSSCSQKLRIFLNLKAIPWVSHPMNLVENENISEYYLGINPRGLVPAIVHNGTVHIESNDIIVYLEHVYPQPSLIPASHKHEIDALLRHENDLHLDLRALSLRFLFAPPQPPKSAEDLRRYATNGSGTVLGEKDAHIAREINFWAELASQGISDEAARSAARNFLAAFTDIESRLFNCPFLMGDSISVLDIAWLVYVHRLSLAGYPFARLHPRVHAWHKRLSAMPEFAPEIALPPEREVVIAARQRKIRESGRTFETVCQL